MTPLRRLRNLYSLCRLVYGPTFQLTYSVKGDGIGVLDWESNDYPDWPSSRGSKELVDSANMRTVGPLVQVCLSALQHAETLDWSARCTEVEAGVEALRCED
jgi:hypothetical protein